MPRCLFTDAELDATTREEHTIPRSLGGRIRSTIVSSSNFNGRSGQRVDPYLAGVYAEVMQVLGPVLPAEARAGSVELSIPGYPGRWRINEFGQLVLARPVVVARDPVTNRPTSAIGPDVDSMQPMIRQLGTALVRRNEELPPQNRVLFPERATIHWRIEVGALKAIMLTFDHLLANTPDRFTRSDSLQELREFVRHVIESDSDAPNVDALADYSLGIQYEQDFLRTYQEIVDAAGIPLTSFDHILIASANQPTRTLDAVFWMFGTDPHAFRLSEQWSGGGFTFVVGNGVLANGSVHGPVSVARTTLLGRPTHRRCRMRASAPLTDAEREAAARQLAETRQDLYRRAVDFVERTSDQHVQDQLSRLARLDQWDHRVASAVFARLVTLFSGSTRTNEAADRFIEIVAPIIDSARDDTLPTANAAALPASGWGYWLDLYRNCLDVLREEFGLPGHIFTANRRDVMNIEPI